MARGHRAPPTAGRKLVGRHSWLCLLAARQSRLGLHKSSGETRVGHAPVAKMDHKQPDVVNVRNGPSRGRSRSVSRSRSRSRSPPAAREPRDDVVRDDQRTTWTLAPNGDQLWGGMVLRRQVESGATVTVREMQAVVGPKTFAALMKLLEASLPDFRESKLDDAIPISALAQAVGPDTMAPLCLASILVGVAKASAAQQAVKDKQDAELQLQRLRTIGRKVTLDELHKAMAMKSFHINTHTAFLDLVEKVGNKHPEIGLDTMIDLDVVAAETGPETMSLLTLVILLTGIPGFVVIHPGLEALFSGSNPFWKLISIPVDGICFGLARK